MTLKFTGDASCNIVKPVQRSQLTLWLLRSFPVILPAYTSALLHYADYSCYVAAVVRRFVGQLRYTQDVLRCPSRTQHTVWGTTIQGGPKKWTPNALYITSSNIGRFYKFFHCYNLQKICNATFIKYPTTPQTHHYTTLWNVCQKIAC